MTKKRVLYTVTDPVTALCFLRGQLAFLDAQGFEPHLACASNREIREFAASEGATIHDVPLSRKWLSRMDLVALVRAVRVLRAVRPAVLNYSTPKAALVWAIASWIARPPFVVFLLRGLRLESERPWRPRFALLWAVERIAARSAHVTVCVSGSLQRRALQLRLVRHDRTRVLGAGSSNGVDSSRFRPISPQERQDARISIGVAASAYVVGFVGRLARDKGIEELLDAIEVCVEEADVRCVLVGSPEPEFDLDAALAARPIAASRTTVRPATSTVEDEYAALDVLVLPSHREGLSNALLEAQARALPCITTDATGCVDAIEPGITGLVVPVRDPRSLANAIALLGRHPDRRSSMGQAGRDRVERLFRPDHVWSEYVALYRSAPATTTTHVTRAGSNL